MSKNVVVFFAEGTEECEALLVVDLLRRAGANVVIASASASRTLTSSHGITIVADALASDIRPEEFDLMVLPGGIPGTPHLAENAAVLAALEHFVACEKMVGAICAAPSILGARGMLDGKHATAHAAFQDKLGGAIVHDEEVIVDGIFTTSYGLGGAIPFALCLVAQLFGKETAAQIQKAIAYKHAIL